MLAKEIERVGIPTALITALTSVAKVTLAQRIVEGKAVVYPIGDAQLPLDQERQWRRSLVCKALDTIRSKVEESGA